jgi:hypothetical protein
MNVFLGILDAAAFQINLFVVVLIWSEIWGVPRKILCSCSLFPLPHHMNTPALLATWIGCAVMAVDDLLRAAFLKDWFAIPLAVLFAFLSWRYYERWKKHRKGRKNGSLAKLLAKVKITSAGLRVVPVKA